MSPDCDGGIVLFPRIREVGRIELVFIELKRWVICGGR